MVNLKTKSILVSRGIINNTNCLLCRKYSAEDWLHLFINYCNTRSIWNSIYSKFVLQSGGFGSIEEEPHDFLSCNDQSKEDNQILPSYASLQLFGSNKWKDRCNRHFSGSTRSYQDVLFDVPSPVRCRAIHFRPASCCMEPSQPCSLQNLLYTYSAQ